MKVRPVITDSDAISIDLIFYLQCGQDIEISFYFRCSKNDSFRLEFRSSMNLMINKHISHDIAKLDPSCDVINLRLNSTTGFPEIIMSYHWTFISKLTSIS